MRRVPEVIDAWYDSGSMPFAQWGYPHADGSVEQFEQAFPAQFICEAIDQTRGWFYTLMAVNTLVHGRSSYENVLCLGHIVAEDGRKMSKHLGNILLPMPLMEDHGADALRWFMAASGSPSQNRRRDRRTYQLDMASTCSASRRPTRGVSNASYAAVTSCTSRWVSESSHRSSSGRSDTAGAGVSSGDHSLALP